MKHQRLPKVILIFLVALAIFSFYFYGADDVLSLKYIQHHLQNIRDFYQASPLKVVSIFLLLYVLITALSIPGSLVLTLLSGAIFGFLPGLLLVGLAATLGATVAFLMARYLFRESLVRKFHRKFLKLNQKIKEEGTSYLLMIRLLPASPYVVINNVLGLTDLKTWKFIWITFVGMLPGSAIYVFAGLKLAEIERPEDIMTWPVIIGLSFLGLLPLISKKLLKLFRRRDDFSEVVS